MFLLNFLVFLMVSWVVYILWKQRKWIEMCSKYHYEILNLPGIGNSVVWAQGGEARMNMLKRFGRYSINNGGLASLWLGFRYFLVVSDASIAEVFLKNCLAKDDVMNITIELLGNGSIFAPVPIWRPRRKVIAPTFSMKNLNQFVEVFYQQSSIMVQQLRQAAGKGTFSVWKYLTSYTMDSVCETALGVKVKAQLHSNHRFIQAFDRNLKLGVVRMLLPPTGQKVFACLPIFNEYMKTINIMHDFVDDIIDLKRKELAHIEESQQNNSNDRRDDTAKKTFLELLIESSRGSSEFTNKELREEALVLILAGTDTSAVGSAFTCLMLAAHPDVQDRVYEEIKEILGEDKRPITPSDLPNMKYLEAVVKETLRLYPPVPAIVRKVEKDLQLPSGGTIVAGTSILINIWAVHRYPQHWGEDAEEFRPDRFIGATLAHPAAFMPFSHGPRSCLGYQYAMMSMKTAIANLVRHYRIYPASPALNKQEPLRTTFDIMMKHLDNYQIRLEIRK